MTRTKSNNGDSPIIPVPEPEIVVATYGWHGNVPFVPAYFTLDTPRANTKFTLNLKSNDEIRLTVRTDDESELEQQLKNGNHESLSLPIQQQLKALLRGCFLS